MTDDLKSEKQEMRRHMKALREEFTGEARRKADEAVWRKIFALPEFKASRTVFAYASFGTEIDTNVFLRTCLDSGKELFLPKVTGKEMAFKRVKNLSDLIPGVWGIPEPDASWETADLTEDFAGSFCLIPGLAFDRDCHRLGYGGGYYDRTFAGCSGIYFLAAAYSFQVVPQVPVCSRDLRASAVVTEEECITLKDKDFHR